jgi:hypothetical protein
MVRSSVAAFYSWLVSRFYSFTGRQRRFLMFGLLLCVRSEIEKIVHWMPEILLAAEIAFRGLDRCVPEQKLDLLQFATAIMAQLGTSSAQIMRSDML